MELPNRTLILIVGLWMILGLVDYTAGRVGGVDEGGCDQFLWSDVVDAMQMSKDIHESDLLVENKPAVNAPKWTVKKVIHSSNDKRIEIPGTFSWGGQPLKVVIATKTDPVPTTIVVFQGTNSVQQLATEFVEGLKSMTSLEIPIPDSGDVKVMRYFWSAYQALDVNGHIGEIDPEMKYIITGHSLGGALASLFALDQAVDGHVGKAQTDIWKNKDTKLITFGQPRVGNQKYVHLHNYMIPLAKKMRFVYNADPVPHIPPRAFEVVRKKTVFMSRHHPIFALLDFIVEQTEKVVPHEDYFHHGQQFWLKRESSDSYEIMANCDPYKEEDCSGSVDPIMYNPIDHLLPDYLSAVKAFAWNPKFEEIQDLIKNNC